MRILLILGVMLSSSVALSADTAKIAIVDLQRALKETKAGKSVEKKLKKEFEAKKKAFEKKQDNIKKMAKDLEKRAMGMSDEVRVQKQRELQTAQMRFQKEVAESQMEIQKKERQLTKPILDKLLKALDKVAQKDGYDLVLQKNDVTVLWSKNSVDITEKVVKQYDK